MRRTFAALGLAAAIAVGLSGCASNSVPNSLIDRPTGTANPVLTPTPTPSSTGIGTISFCVGEDQNHKPREAVIISVYRNTDILGLKKTFVARRVQIPIATGHFDVIVSNTIVMSGDMKNGQTISGQTGRFCPAA